MNNFFIKKVDHRSRESLTDFLCNHFRYSTMNSWNLSTSYAHNVKIHRLGLTNTQQNKAFELLETDNFYDNLNGLINNFDYEHDHQWQVGFNGRSGGYIVLYQGGWEYSDYKSWCPYCGQRNFQLVTDNSKACGRCGKDRVNYTNPPKQYFTYSGRDTDQGETFEDWSMDQIKDRVQLVQSFDQLAEDMRNELIYMIENYKVEEESYIVTKTRKIMEAA